MCMLVLKLFSKKKFVYILYNFIYTNSGEERARERVKGREVGKCGKMLALEKGDTVFMVPFLQLQEGLGGLENLQYKELGMKRH